MNCLIDRQTNGIELGKIMLASLAVLIEARIEKAGN
jgi:hypothetical protein